MSKILGISYYVHDTTVCLIIDGKIECILEQEKMDGVKSCYNLYAHPKTSLDYIEEKYGVNFDNSDHIVFSLPYKRDFVSNLEEKYRDKITSQMSFVGFLFYLGYGGEGNITEPRRKGVQKQRKDLFVSRWRIRRNPLSVNTDYGVIGRNLGCFYL